MSTCRTARMLRTTASGVVGAMAMTGLRTAAAGLTEPGARGGDASPPEAVVDAEGRALLGDRLDRLPEHRRRAATEVLHWGYGAGGGLAFALLPARLRERAVSGPLYGVALWVLFDRVLAPALGVQYARRAPVGWRAAVLADHLLYGVVVGRARA